MAIELLPFAWPWVWLDEDDDEEADVDAFFKCLKMHLPKGHLSQKLPNLHGMSSASCLKLH
jgi:hypothetical protein